MNLPPTRDILETIQNAVLPAAGGAALIVCVSHVLGRVFIAIASRLGACWEYFRTGYLYRGARGAALCRHLVGLGVAFAVVVGFMAGNFSLSNIPPGEVPTWNNTTRLISWKPGENPAGWNWLPRAGLLLIAVGLLSRWVGSIAAHSLPDRLWWGANLFVWTPRLAAVVIASGWLSSGKANEGVYWLSQALGLRFELACAMFLVWLALDGLAYPRPSAEAEYEPNREPDASGSVEAAGYLWLISLAAAALLLYSHSARFMEIALILSAAMFGVAVAAGPIRADASAVVPAGVAFIPGLMLAAHSSLPENAVPDRSFWLIALAPLVLIPFQLPALARRQGWFVRLIRVVLVLAPLLTAIVLAAQHETIAGQEEW
ncbi:MAG TPA: hypothetical protein VLM40_07450 [Gemmata sp.]|nr:hypothetical protein [Gemmata sp.]